MALALAAAPVPAPAQSPAPPPAEHPDGEKGTYLGVLFTPVPDVLYDQLPRLPRGQGVVAAHVLPESPAAAAGLRRNDVILRYGDQPVRDCEHFARLIHDDRPGRTVRLALLRGGQDAAADVTLALGPVLRIARAARPGTPAIDADTRPANPFGVTVTATPLPGNTLKVTIAYYPEGDRAPQKAVTCTGTPEEIAAQIQRLPDRVQELARVGLQRLHALPAAKQ